MYFRGLLLIGFGVSMGKVRPKLIKNIAKELLELYPDKFTTDFETNKRLVQLLTDIRSKKLRNRVAGYITHLVKLRMRARETEERTAIEAGPEITSPEVSSGTE